MKNQASRMVRGRCALALLSSAFIAAPSARAQEQLWAKQFGSGIDDGAYASAADGEGVFLAGWTRGDLAAPFAGGYADAFVRRHGRLGEHQWTVQIGSGGQEAVQALAADGAGGVFIAGYTSGVIRGGNWGEVDLFIARYDKDGNKVWLKQFGTAGSEYPNALAPDGAGGFYMCGLTTGRLGGSPRGSNDAFIARYTGTGNQIWIQQFGSAGDDHARAVAPDGFGGVFVCGSTAGSVSGVNFGGYDGFLAHYDSSGKLSWIGQYGTVWGDYAAALESDGTGGVYVGGLTMGDLGGPNAGQLGSTDAYLARYTIEGKRRWIRQFGTKGSDQGLALTTDGEKGVFFAGIISGELFAPYNYAGDLFLVRYGEAGNQIWGTQFGSPSEDRMAGSLSGDGKGGVYLAGETEGALAAPLTGGTDAFIVRIGDRSCYLAQYADCDQSTGVGVLDIFDFLCFQNAFVGGKGYACNCDTSTGPATCDVFDFLCFQDAFVAGGSGACP